MRAKLRAEFVVLLFSAYTGLYTLPYNFNSTSFATSVYSYDKIMMWWEPSQPGNWWDKWQARVNKRLQTAVQNDSDVHAYCVFGSDHPSSGKERGYARGIQDAYPSVQFHFTKIELL